MATVDFRILTGLDVRVAGRSLRAIAAKQRTVLAILLLHPNEVVQIDLMVEGVWGDRPPASARNLIKTYVWRLRQLLDGHEVTGAPSRIATVADGYALRVLPGELDAERFEQMVRSGREALAAGDLALAADRLATALAQWPGEALRDTPLEGRFAAQLHALGERRLAVLGERIMLDMRLGRYSELIPELQTLIAAEPLHEVWHAHLVRALYQSGRRIAALSAYSAARQTLVAELGLEPGPELRSLQQSILSGGMTAPDADAPGTHADASGLAAGAGWQAGRKPGQRAVPPPAPRQLPSGLSALIGRAAEIAQLVPAGGARGPAAGLTADLGGAGQHLAVTVITGAPGAGKTALAVQAAHLLKADFPDGQLFAAISAHSGVPRTSRQVLAGFLQALGVPAVSQPGTVAEMAALYRSLTAGRRLLVVLDDVRNEVLARTLLPAPGASGVIITSRRILAGLEEARLLTVGMLRPDEAASLLIRSSNRIGADPADAGVERTVTLCGGLPLAVRIAGARLAARPDWTFADIADRLEDESGRLNELVAGDRSVRAAFRRSYSSLDLAAQQAFRLTGRLRSRRFTASDALVAGGAGLGDLQQAFERLVDANLLQTTAPGEFSLHSLIGVFAAECATDRAGQLIADVRTLRRASEPAMI